MSRTGAGEGGREKRKDREDGIAVCVPPHNQARKTDPTCPSKNISVDVKKFTGQFSRNVRVRARALVIKPVRRYPAGAGAPTRRISSAVR